MNSLKLILSDLKYFAPCSVFASINILTGTWVLYLPFIKSKLTLNDAEIGTALFCFGLGILVSMPMVPLMSKKFGIGSSTKWGIIFFAIAFIFPLSMPSYCTLLLSLIFVGFFSGFTDISMNALVSTIEQEDNIHFMSAAHGFFSLGGFIGASLGILIMRFIETPLHHMLLMIGFIIISNVFLARYYIEIKERYLVKEKSASTLFNIKSLAGIAVVAFIIMSNEGAVEHWSTLFLHEIIGVAQNNAGLGFLLFSFCMMIGRFFGDGISEKFGSTKITLVGLLIALAAYLCIISTQLILSIFGFGLLGMGLSVIIPELFRMAGNSDKVSASVGISFVSGVGFTGFLLGPFLIGYISEVRGLVYSYMMLGVSIGVALLLSFLLNVKRR
jgi:MFS family permease